MKQTSIATGELTSAEIYRMLTGLVIPRPIALVSTLSPQGQANLAPFSFFTVASADPPVVALGIGPRYPDQTKDTLRNIEQTGEFVVNVVSQEIAEAMNVTSLDWAPEVDEFMAAQLTPRFDNLAVKPPRVEESPGQFECRLMSCTQIGTWTLVLGEVVAFHCADALLDERYRVSAAGWRAVGRLAGAEYCDTSNRFAIERQADTPALDIRGQANKQTDPDQEEQKWQQKTSATPK